MINWHKVLPLPKNRLGTCITDTKLLLMPQSPNCVVTYLSVLIKKASYIVKSNEGSKSGSLQDFHGARKLSVSYLSLIKLWQFLWNCITIKSFRINGRINYNKAIISFLFSTLCMQDKKMPPILSGFMLLSSPVNCIFICSYVWLKHSLFTRKRNKTK